MAEFKRRDAIILGFGLLLIVIITIYSNIKRNNLNKYSFYTVGTVTSIGHTGISGTYWAEYYYYVNNKRYVNSNSRGKHGKEILKKKFIVKFEQSNPENSQIYLDYEIPSYFPPPPSSGWLKVPSISSKEIIKHRQDSMRRDSAAILK